ncbi:MAG TPA: potassium transporter Kup [Burkholderiales bacterium]|nr:potassium transporter Kup [Burkholderiales bacterium]
MSSSRAASPAEPHGHTVPSSLPVLAVAALGVVYGDIGTSPLYTIKEVFTSPHHPLPVTPENVLGILSLILWSLILVVSVKYVGFVMRADNRGEGGIMALIALALGDAEGNPGREKFVIIIGILGAAMFYGDGMITPAISVLSAVEGLEVATPALKPYVIPVTVVVLIALFIMQRHGTARVGAFFGPVMTVWFLTLGVLGVINIQHAPGVLKAVNPAWAASFFLDQKMLAFIILGAVVLAVTGSETLYADMGHFGRKPIRLAWFGFVLPALLINYFGQGALVLREPDAVASPFYHMAPDWALYPLVALATLATVIASQAVISGAFSVTRQAMQLGFVPRMEVQHTSEKERGQIYLPFVNWSLLALVLALVLGFGSSGNLAAAYGIAVTGDMVITSILAAMVVSRVWGWGVLRAGALFGCFLVVELSFFGANVLKIPDGGWFPLVAGLVVFTLMTTWKRGRALLNSRLKEQAIDLDPFIGGLAHGGPTRVPGTAVFMTPNFRGVPHALLHNLKHNKVLHEKVVLVTVVVRDVPHVPEAEQVRAEPLKENFWRVGVYYGFMDETNLPADLERCARFGLVMEPMDTSYFIGRETLIPKIKSDMPYWREKIFVAMFRNAGSVTDFFRLPPNRVVEVGTQVML